MSENNRILAIPARERIRQRQDETRARILRDAARLFVVKGFANVSVEDLISASEIARSSFYRFFANREDVLTSIIRPVFQSGIDKLGTIDETDPDAILPGILNTYLDLWQEGPDAVRLSTRTGGVHFELFKDIHMTFARRITALLETLAAAGRLRNQSADYTARLIARTAVPVLEVYSADPRCDVLFQESMRGFLLRG
ncbi:MAG: TetR/AcrR family transcriptional regulator [Chromatiales bacterium]|nr:TetR/AcrR family transcriptional regulator [Chromatiales bacterium]